MTDLDRSSNLLTPICDWSVGGREVVHERPHTTSTAPAVYPRSDQHLVLARIAADASACLNLTQRNTLSLPIAAVIGLGPGTRGLVTARD